MTITSDKLILQTVAGATLDFDDSPTRVSKPRAIHFSDYERECINKEMNKFLQLDIVERVEHMYDEFVSNIFIRDKKDGSHRVILNLLELNQFIAYHHFKMDTIDTVINLMRPDCFMASVDLSNAYFSIPVAKAHRKYLRFEWCGELFQFKVLPNGLSSAPRMFTKVLKPVYAHLRQMGHVATGYIDDTFIMSNSCEGCVTSIECTTGLLTSLGFYINTDKSVTIPTQELEHLGFLLNSKSMTVSLTARKKENLLSKCTQLLKARKLTIRAVAELIGLIVSSFTAVEFGRLHYRHLELNKVQALKGAAGDFDASIVLTDEAKTEIHWWIDHVMSEIRHVDHGPFVYSLTTDASEEGWGAVFESLPVNGDQQSSGGRWTIEEKLDHINVLELKAGLLGLQTFCANVYSCHVKLNMDNTTSICYVNNFGGTRSFRCNEIAQEFWDFCRQHNLWVTAAHIPGRFNILADEKSRLFDDKTEWRLNPLVFGQITQRFGTPTIDLFASRLNYQLKPFVAWGPDPEASFTDAFTLNWATWVFYAFPPFSILLQVIKKIEYDGAKGILIVPNWPTQAWFPLLRRLLLAEPMRLTWQYDLVTLPFRQGQHPMGRKLNLMACLLCGARS